MCSASIRNLFQREASQLDSSDKDDEPSSSPKPGKPGMRRSSSIQRVPVRAMSALGTRAFAAPEVKKEVRRKTVNDAALSSHVSDYGLIADAYSVGATIKVLLTGVPADASEMEFISSQENILLNIISALCACGKDKGSAKRKKRYKFLDEAPKPARELVRKLMKPVYEDRLTAPLARDEPWIKGGVSADDPIVKLPTGDIPAGNDDPIKCLKCATRL